MADGGHFYARSRGSSFLRVRVASCLLAAAVCVTAGRRWGASATAQRRMAAIMRAARSGERARMADEGERCEMTEGGGRRLPRLELSSAFEQDCHCCSTRCSEKAGPAATSFDRSGLSAAGYFAVVSLVCGASLSWLCFLRFFLF